MEDIRIISTSSIQAPSHVIGELPQKIYLTPWDLIFLTIEMNQKGLLFHNPINTKHTNSLQIQHLKQSLSSTLAFFPPLAGRLAIHENEDNTASSYILCNNSGAIFVHAIANNTSVADILKPNYVPQIVHSLFPLNGVKNYEGTSKPLLAVQVTELVDGIFIGCTINHAVADGNSFWHFINSWAEISRGCNKPTKLPILERWFMDGVDDLPIRFPFTNEEKQHSQNFKSQSPPERIFNFTKEKIAQLKSKANAEANTDKISSLQALLTHLWRSVISAQQLDPQKETRYMLFIGARGRMVNPQLAENYFGNAGLVGGVTMKIGELLLEGGFGKGAWEINKMISLHCQEKFKSHYESWMITPMLFRLGGVASSNALATSSSPRFNVYGNDFGWGKPVAVRSGAANNSNGKITVFEGVEEGSVDIEVCLPYEILEAMGNDPVFMDANSKLIKGVQCQTFV